MDRGTEDSAIMGYGVQVLPKQQSDILGIGLVTCLPQNQKTSPELTAFRVLPGAQGSQEPDF